MLVEEARWLGRRIAEQEADEVFPLLNVGSSTEAFRAREQPHIDALIFRPLRERQRAVTHADLKPAPGVDVVGDLLEPAVIERLAAMEFRSVLCSNLLEHVEDPRAICRSIVSLLPPGGYVFVSSPYRYPFHPDPIDTMLRPNIEELGALFDGTRLVCAETIRGGRYLRWPLKQPAQVLRNLLLVACPFYKPSRWLWNFRSISCICAVLRKVGGGPHAVPEGSCELARQCS